MCALHSGRLSCLQYAYRKGCHKDYKIKANMCASTSAECLEYVLDHNFRLTGFGNDRPDSNLDLVAVRLCSLSCIEKLILKHEWKGFASTACAAVETGDPAILARVIQADCTLSGSEANLLVQRGRTDNVMELLGRGQRLNHVSVRQLGQRGELVLLHAAEKKEFCNTGAAVAASLAQFVSLTTLVTAFNRGLQGCEHVCEAAVKRKDLAMLQCADQHGCPITLLTCIAAVESGDLVGLQYALEHRVEGTKLIARDSELLILAARGGHLSCLRYLHEHCGGILTTKTACNAARADSPACLQYLHEHRCSDNSVAAVAEGSGVVETGTSRGTARKKRTLS